VLGIPVIGRRVREVIRRAGVPFDSYSGQRMVEVLRTYPRTELFSTDVDSLYQTVTGVLSLAQRRTVRLFCRRDPYGRFFSCLVYLGIDRMLSLVSELARGDRWHALARLTLRGDLYASLRKITLDALHTGDVGIDPATTIAAWERRNSARLSRARATLNEISDPGKPRPGDPVRRGSSVGALMRRRTHHSRSELVSHLTSKYAVWQPDTHRIGLDRQLEPFATSDWPADRQMEPLRNRAKPPGD
jgi:glutamate dehydrogenase